MTYDINYKIKLVTKILRGHKVSEVAAEHDIPKDLLCKWKSAFLEGRQEVLKSEK